MFSIVILPIEIALLLSLTIEAAPLDLAALCDGVKIELKTVADLEALKEQVDKASDECPKRVYNAINDMAAIVKERQACRMDKAQAITRFVDNYLKQTPVEIPDALANFAIAYGMQVSRICSQEMVDNFAVEADARIHDRLGAKDYPEFLQFKKHLVDKSPVGVILSSILKTGELILPDDLLGSLPESVLKEKLQIELPESEKLAKFKGFCENLMQPLYEATLLPLAHLNRAGFTSKAHYRRSQFKRNSRFWSAIVFFCESLKVIEVRPLESVEQAQDVHELQEMAQGLADQIERDDQNAATQLAADTPMEKYESEQQVDDEIMNHSIKSLVKNFNANKSEAERLRGRIQSRSFHIIKALIKRAKYRTAIKKMATMIKVKGRASEQVQAALSGLVDSNEADLLFAGTNEQVDFEVTPHERKKLTTLLGSLIAGLGITLIVLLWIVIVSSCRGGGGRSSGGGYGGGGYGDYNYGGYGGTTTNVYYFNSGGGNFLDNFCRD